MRRNRPVTSCLQCRRRRVRCDRERPVCARCTAGGLSCLYDERATAARSDRAIARPHPVSSLVKTDGPQIHDSSRQVTPNGCLDVSTPQRDNQDKGQISVYQGGRSVYRGSTHWANAIGTDPDQNGQSDDEMPIQRPSLFPRWPPKDDGRVEPSGRQFRPPRPSESTWSPSQFEHCKFCGRKYNMSCLMTLLPSRGTCERLCEMFFATVFPLAPVLQVKGFAEDFRTFWDGIGPNIVHGSNPNPLLRKNPSFLCLLSAILFASLVSAPESRLQAFLEEKTDVNAEDMYFLATVSATLTSFPRRPAIYSLAAYVIVHGQFIREEEFADDHDFISTAFRIALSMGLHRHLPQAGFSIAESETRRRLWWYILHLDVMSSVSSGLSPLFIDDKMANTDVISQYDQLENSPGGINEIDVRYLVASQRFAITKEIRQVLRSHFEDSLYTLDEVKYIELRLQEVYEKTKEITQLLLRSGEEATRSLVKTSHETPPQHGTPNPSSKAFDRVWKLRPDPGDNEVVDFSAWSVLLLHMMVHKAYCALYHPLFRNRNMSGYEEIRTNAVKHAQAFLQLFFRVCNDRVSEAFHWMYPGTYQPLQAMSLLLADLLQRPYSEHAALSQGLIDCVLDLYQVEHGIVTKSNPPQRRLSPSGKAAWTMLVRTRRKALEQIGVDHHVLFPSSAVSSEFCICGERISQEHLGGPQELDQERQPSPAPGFEIPEEYQGLTSDQIIVPNVDFDWDAWDNALGQAVGIAP